MQIPWVYVHKLQNGLFFMLLVMMAEASSTPVGLHSSYDLRVEHMPSPALSIDASITKPRFSWRLLHPARAQHLTSYRIIVSTDVKGSAVMWDSGKVPSSPLPFGHLVPYAGIPLTSGSTFYWTVVWWDADDIQSQDAMATFDTAPSSSDWARASWVSGYGNTALIRGEVSLSHNPVRARLYVASLGFADLYVNGRSASDTYFGNGWTAFCKRTLFTTVDVTAALIAGNNTIAASLAIGWADNVAYPPKTGCPSYPLPQVRLLLAVTYEDGSVINWGSSTQMITGPSPVTNASIYNGETYDARLETDGWNSNGFMPPASWNFALSAYGPGGLLSSLMHPPIRALEVVKPTGITSPQPGVFVVHFPRNFAGVCRLRVKGPAGSKVTLRHAEILKNDGSGMIYTENLRSALAADAYILKGSLDVELYSPRFTYHGFAHVEVTGFPGTLTLDDIDALHIASNIPFAGEVSFSSIVLSKLQEMAVNGQRSNLMSVPTDCDQRDERLGWMGDANLSAESFSLNFDMAAFWANFLRLIVDEQGGDGSVANVIPAVRYANRPGDPSWAGALTTIPRVSMQMFADDGAALENFNAMNSFVTYLDAQLNATGMAKFWGQYGDWCPPPPQKKSPVSFTAASSYIQSVQDLAIIALELGQQQEAQQLQAEVTRLLGLYNAAFRQKLHLHDQGYLENAQTELSIALMLGAADAEELPAVSKLLLDDIAANKVHMTTGIIGVKALFPALSSIGRQDVAMDIAEQSDYPSWGYMAFNSIEPASAVSRVKLLKIIISAPHDLFIQVWEILDAPFEGPGMNSRNHHMFSSVSAWLYDLAGISQSPLSFGLTNLELHPASVSGLSSANAHVLGIRGRSFMRWTVSGGQQCALAPENQMAFINCGDGGSIIDISFASFGTPVGGCGAGLALNTSCHSVSSLEVVKALCVGQSNCSVPANTASFGGDPCFGHFKRLAVAATCKAPPSLNVQLDLAPDTTAYLFLPLLGLQVNTSTFLRSLKTNNS
jgi:alpha-L-rhamnosidase